MPFRSMKNIFVLSALGFSCGLPYMLVFSTLSAWLRDAGAALTVIGFISWAALTYSLKFLWSPFVDRIKMPLNQVVGQRRSWILMMQLLILILIIMMSQFDPISSLNHIVITAVLIAFFGSLQDIAVDAYRIELVSLDEQGNLAASYQFGYRLSILVATSLALIFADLFSWQTVYLILSFFMLIGVMGVFVGETPETFKVDYGYVENLLSSFKDFFKRIGVISASVLLFIIATYRLTDIIMGPMAMPFYIDMGYSKTEIGAIVKTVALGASILGFFVGGQFIHRFTLRTCLIFGGLLVLITNLLFCLTALSESNLTQLSIIVGMDSLAAGFVGTVNITFLTSLVSKKFTATQYALLTSFMMLPGKLFSGLSGLLADSLILATSSQVGWAMFFVLTSILALPSMFVIYLRKDLFKLAW
ncbi:MAG: MFS transporter [Gammaproteobacteria bacterium TMED104]|nr:MAG: MFS transporter [Gammaproteobacteria bacterium TMED104]